MSFGEAIKTCFSKYAAFDGRARRSEYWYFQLFTFLVGLVLGVLSVGILSTIWSLAILIPGLAVSVRRMHDVGKSGFTILVAWIPGVLTGIVMVIAALIAGVGSGDVMAMIGAAGIVGIIGGLITLGCSIYLIILYIKDSAPGTNQYGPNPKEYSGASTYMGGDYSGGNPGGDYSGGGYNPGNQADPNRNAGYQQVNNFCPDCGARLDGVKRFCPYCGHKFD